MAAVAGSQPIVHADHIQVGEVKIPIGHVEMLHIENDKTSGRIHTVMIRTQGGMGRTGKEALIGFQFQTAEKSNQFVLDLLKTTGGMLRLFASFVHVFEPSGDGVKGFVEIHFQDNRELDACGSAVASFFFPGFTTKVCEGKILQLTSMEGTVDQITEIVEKALKPLQPPALKETLRSFAFREKRYFVTPDGTVQEELMIRTDPYLQRKLVPLKPPTDQDRRDRRAALNDLIRIATALSEMSVQHVAPLIERLRMELAKKEAEDAVEGEVCRNLTETLILSVAQNIMELEKTLPEEQRSAFQEIKARLLKELTSD